MKYSVPQLNELAVDIERYILNALNITSALDDPILYDPMSVVSKTKVLDVVEYVMRDLSRIELDQDKHFSVSKYIGYIIFWIARVKPVNGVFSSRSDSGEENIEIIDINERLAISVGLTILLTITAKNPELVLNYSTVDATDNKNFIENFIRSVHDYFRSDDTKHYNYIIYCMRYRPIDPYFFSTLINVAIFSVCRRIDINLAV